MQQKQQVAQDPAIRLKMNKTEQLARQPRGGIHTFIHGTMDNPAYMYQKKPTWYELCPSHTLQVKERVILRFNITCPISSAESSPWRITRHRGDRKAHDQQRFAIMTCTIDLGALQNMEHRVQIQAKGREGCKCWHYISSTFIRSGSVCTHGACVWPAQPAGRGVGR